MDSFGIPVEKISDFELSKLLYGLKNKRHELRIMGNGTADGYIILLNLPCGSNGHNNDATILDTLMDMEYIEDSKENSENIFYREHPQLILMTHILDNTKDVGQLDRG